MDQGGCMRQLGGAGVGAGGMGKGRMSTIWCVGQWHGWRSDCNLD